MGNEKVIGYLEIQSMCSMGGNLLNIGANTSSDTKTESVESQSELGTADNLKKDSADRFNNLLKDEKEKIASTDDSSAVDLTKNNENDCAQQTDSKTEQTDYQVSQPIDVQNRISAKTHPQIMKHLLLIKNILSSNLKYNFASSSGSKNETDLNVNNQTRNISNSVNRNLLEKNNDSMSHQTSRQTTLDAPSRLNSRGSSSQSSQLESNGSDFNGKPTVLTTQGASVVSHSADPSRPGIRLTELAVKLNTNIVVENTETSVNTLKSLSSLQSDLKPKAILNNDTVTDNCLDKPNLSTKSVQKASKSNQQDSDAKSDLSDHGKQSPTENNNSSTAQSGESTSRNFNNVKPPSMTSLEKNASMPQPPIDQAKLVDNIKLTLTSGRSELTIQLKPEVLGSALVTLRKTDNGLELEFQVESAHAKQAIEVEVPQIREALAAVGIHTSSIDVKTSDFNPERFSTPENGGNGQRGQGKQDRSSANAEQQIDNLRKFRNLGYNTFEIAA